MSSHKKENPLINLLANVVAPVFILNKFSSSYPIPALILALSLPIGYGIWSFISTRQMNYISVLGLANTLFTGGFALLKFEGIWFTVKEAAFPFLIGCFVLGSSFTKKPFLKMMLVDTGALNMEEIDSHLHATNKWPQFLQIIKRSTFFFSLTFFLSAALNFVLAFRIFKHIPMELPEAQRSEILNSQIAEMTWMGYAVIFIPSIALFFLIMYYFFKKTSQLTEIPMERLVKS
ncbi:MAG: hypothetical protein K2Q26_05650 [Bdellovibrionales bacterium]|nr:hypothetical protein [Bdellovibrionales bacterium]